MPGSAENSFLFHRISGSDYGMQMPPTGALKPEQIDTIKRWIEQGADWPDALANETELPPSDPTAVAMVNALHEGDLAQFMKFAAEDAKLLNARGPEGSTPFMYAVLYRVEIDLWVDDPRNGSWAYQRSMIFRWHFAFRWRRSAAHTKWHRFRLAV